MIKTSSVKYNIYVCYIFKGEIFWYYTVLLFIRGSKVTTGLKYVRESSHKNRKIGSLGRYKIWFMVSVDVFGGRVLVQGSESREEEKTGSSIEYTERC